VRERRELRLAPLDKAPYHRVRVSFVAASCESSFTQAIRTSNLCVLRGGEVACVEILVSCLWWHWVSVAMAATAMAAASMASLSLRGGSSFQEFNGLAPSSSFRPSLAVPPTHRPCESLNEIFVYPCVSRFDCNEHTTHAADRAAPGALSILLCLPSPNVQAERIGPIPGIGTNFSFLRFMVHLHFVSCCIMCAEHESMAGIVLVEN
jgi:hypothetical protein